MPKNNLRKLRKKAGLTQRQLAEKAGTSQQQIQRLEAGVQEITLALAFHLCDALGQTMDAVFPSAAKPISAVLKKNKKGDKDTHPITRIRSDEKATAKLAAVGIDTDCGGNALKFSLSNGVEEILPISGIEKNRLWHNVQAGDSDFIVFDSGPRRFAVNRRYLSFCQFLWGMPFEFRTDEDKEGSSGIDVYLASSKEPLHFSADYPEGGDLDDEDREPGELEGIFFSLEIRAENDAIEEPLSMISFLDEDGERAFFRVADVAMFVADLCLVEPGLIDAEIEGDEEDQAKAEKKLQLTLVTETPAAEPSPEKDVET